MGLYVFSSIEPVTAKQLAASEQTVRALGGTVVRSLAGVMLVELAAPALRQVAKLLPDWRWSPQRKTAHVPEYRQRVRARVRKTALSEKRVTRRKIQMRSATVEGAKA